MIERIERKYIKSEKICLLYKYKRLMADIINEVITVEDFEQ